jgi:diguanylate cyclase (GGDEF)-like protein
MPAGFTRYIHENFSAKIVILVVGSVLLTSLVVGIVTTNTTKKFLVDKATEKFPSTLTSTYSRIRAWYARCSRDLDELCASTVFRGNISACQSLRSRGGDVAAEQAELSRYLSLVHGKFPVYEEILLFDGDGGMIAATAPAENIESQRATAAGLIRETGRVRAFSEAHFRSDLTGVYQWMFVPIVLEDGSAWWLAASVSLEHVAELVDEVSIGGQGEMYLLDDQGRFLTQPRHANRNVLREHAMQVPTRQEGPVLVEIRKNYRGEKVFHSKVHLEEHGWWLVYEDDYGTAIAPVVRAQRQIWVAVLFIGILAVAVALRIVRSVLQPIRSLALGARRINEGLVGVKIPRVSGDEIGLLTDTFNEMAKTITLSKAELQYKNKMLNTQNDQLQDMNVRLEQLSVTDGLTGLYNHRHFWNILDQELARVDRYKGELALILVDLDDFKRVNDQFGHSVGDLLLQSVSGILRETVRDTDVVARYGGEEFAILLPETDRKGVESVAEKLRESVESMRFTVPDSDINLRVTVSVGISVFRGNRREFFNSADKALYQSKAGGKNRINFAVA